MIVANDCNVCQNRRCKKIEMMRWNWNDREGCVECTSGTYPRPARQNLHVHTAAFLLMNKLNTEYLWVIVYTPWFILNLKFRTVRTYLGVKLLAWLCLRLWALCTKAYVQTVRLQYPAVGCRVNKSSTDCVQKTYYCLSVARYENIGEYKAQNNHSKMYYSYRIHSAIWIYSN